MEKNSTNKPLIIFSVFASLVWLALADASEQVKLTSFADYVGTVTISLIIFPFVAMWFKALWNEIAHKIFSLPVINGWQALGILALMSFLLA